MIFNSIQFVIFFATVFILYYSVLKEKTKQQNILLLIASYVFYGFANWKIIPLLFVSTLLFYWLGIEIAKSSSEKKKSWLTTAGVCVGIGTLLYFKYTNFFITAFKDLFNAVGLQIDMHTLNILVPVGISFYTFRLLSYVIDIYRGKYEPTRDFVSFSTYVAFFPCILSGPIDRPNTLLPQLQSTRSFDYTLAVDGMRQILWGLFKKMVIADNCALVVNMFFEDYNIHTGSTLLLSAILLTIQWYADFSGYSDMAIGIGKLLGFRLTTNFQFPLFALNIADFWRRWHISLTNWLTDYVFMPLNIKWRNLKQWGLIFAIVINFVICGFWHGANLTFILWGFYNGLLFIPLILSGSMFKKAKIKTVAADLPTLKTLGKMLLTFMLVTLGLIVAKANSPHIAFDYIGKICSASIMEPVYIGSVVMKRLMILMIAVPVLLIVEWHNRKCEHGLSVPIFQRIAFCRWSFYIFLALMTAMMGGVQQDFVYFKF
jgi:D-alanyl-lipoteichoic acid acyltransferase DltB (MBOAT superfamily)